MNIKIIYIAYMFSYHKQLSCTHLQFYAVLFAQHDATVHCVNTTV